MNEARQQALKLTKMFLKLPPETARKVIADEKARRAKIHEQEAKQAHQQEAHQQEAKKVQ